MTLTPIDAASVRMADHIRPGDLVSWGQGMAEPLALIAEQGAGKEGDGVWRR